MNPLTGLSTWDGARRCELLYGIAEAMEARRREIVAVAAEETGLALARLEAEFDRTTGQLRLLGEFAAAGRDRAVVASRGAAPGGADVVLVRVPIGPVAVFAASNFPLAFGVLGGDTAAALAAGCPVVVKAHPAQPRTAELLAACAPAEVLTLRHGGPDASLELVRDPSIRAVAFTGSPAGGRALMDAAAARPEPIPVYAEMGSLNPVFVLPSALAPDADWPAVLAAAVTGSSGQLCTKPGLVIAPDDEAGRAFGDRLAQAVSAAPLLPRMLTPAIEAAHRAWSQRAGAVAFAEPDSLGSDLLEEHFGPSVVVCFAPVADYAAVASRLHGSLTATVLAAPDDPALDALLPSLIATAGRIVFNGVPTGVAVCDAMHHGGPWPSTSNPLYTSVGTAAVARFLRPVALQGLPARFVP
ncbi:aldehyde dehydrogenase (NADP(+)) [Dactylosporangium darangshiense]|uniref:Aldehyde dehydrogenase (NADP(+)) n=1 Tax=Dactylosporangium darangshiense TaxID=579108 RepID=A0ABP8DAP2_9ACTN